MARLKDIPKLERDSSNIAAYAEAVREALQTLRGIRGDKLDRALTLRDLQSGTIAGGSSTTIIGGGVGGPGGTMPDPTPPPTVTSLAVTAGISHIYVSHDAPTYTQGHGHDRTVVYGAKWPDGVSPPTFGDAVELFTFLGSIGSYPTDPDTRWCIWAKWRSMDQYESASPAGGTNGIQATTGQDVTTLLQALNEAAADGSRPYSRVSFRADQFYIQPDCDFSQEATPVGTIVNQLWYKPSTGETKRWDGAAWQAFSAPLPFLVQTAPTTINGVTIPAGVYMDSAFIYDLTASIARLGTAWIDDAMVASMSVNKLTAGTLQIGEEIVSANYVPNVAGWRISGSGAAQLPAASILGQLTAAQINTSGLDIKDAAGNVVFSSGVARATSDENICWNPSGDNASAAGWASSVGIAGPNSWFGDASYMLYTQYSDQSFVGAGPSGRFRVYPGEQFHFYVETLPQGGGSSAHTFRLGVAVYDVNEVLLAVVFPATRSGALSGVRGSSGSYTMPANAYRAFIYVSITPGSGDLGSAAGYYFRRVIVRRKITAANASTFIADASIGTAQIDTLNASKITAGTITADRIVSDGITKLAFGSAAGPVQDSSAIASVTVTPDVACSILVTATGTMTCTNSLGSTKLRKSSFSVYHSGAAYGTVNVSGNIANGETIDQPCASHYVFTGVSGGAPVTFAVRQANNAGASIDQQVVDVFLRVEIIYR